MFGLVERVWRCFGVFLKIFESFRGFSEGFRGFWRVLEGFGFFLGFLAFEGIQGVWEF